VLSAFSALARSTADARSGPRAAGRAGHINALAIEAFNDLLKKYGRRQSVENPLLGD
jgi:hypothetical protein